MVKKPEPFKNESIAQIAVKKVQKEYLNSRQPLGKVAKDKAPKPKIIQAIVKEERFPVVGIGASAGGLEALKILFGSMPKKIGMAFVVIQHLDPTRESFIVDLLTRYTKLKVQVIENAQKIEKNQIYVIPPNKDVSLYNSEFILSTPNQKRGRRTPIDYFFTSLAQDQQEYALGIILSGTGSDGSIGIREIKKSDGIAIVQTPVSALFDGMPVSAIATGAVDYILPIDEISDILSKIEAHLNTTKHLPTKPVGNYIHPNLNNLLSIVLTQTGQNFRFYKISTLQRRIERRMTLNHCEDMSEYAKILQESPIEVKTLCNDFLVSVTDFFRDPESWEELEEKVIKKMVKEKKDGKTIRIWVPGCSTGEEAYTLALLFWERFLLEKKRPDIQIFATDLNKDVLDVARLGRYTKKIKDYISSKRLKTFFDKVDKDHYSVCRQLRSIVIFSLHNMIGDPPFSNLDLISCRNVIIYLESDIQKKLHALFHFALKKGGYLYLGKTESLGEDNNYFELISSLNRIYRKIDIELKDKVEFPIIPLLSTQRSPVKKISQPFAKPSLSTMVEQTLLGAYAPASVLVNSHYDILYFFGQTSEYLNYPTGIPTCNLFSIVRDGLYSILRSVLQQVIKEKKNIVIKDVQIKQQEKFRMVTITVRPLKKSGGDQSYFLISFEDVKKTKEPAGLAQDPPSLEDSTYIKALENELNTTRDDLQSNIEELESANEEMMSMNEELQSSNEELMTSKEELQSLNEELSTVNSELLERIDAVQKSSNDLHNLINASEIATLFIDNKLKIRFFTPSIQKILNLNNTDINRLISDFSAKLIDCNLESIVEEVLDTIRVLERNVQSKEGDFFRLKCSPYRTLDQRIDGVVFTFFNITTSLDTKEHLKNIELRYNSLYQNLLEGVCENEIMYDGMGKASEYRILNVNPAYELIFKVNKATVIGKISQELYGLSYPSILEKYKESSESGLPVKFRSYFSGLNTDFHICLNAWPKGKFTMIFLASTEVNKKRDTSGKIYK